MSKITEYRKLVRDKIPEILEAQGVKGTFHTADHEEYETELLEKLREEVLEFKNAKSVEELADLLEVVDAVIAHFAWKQEDIQAVKAHKLSERGGFSKRLILEQTEE
jgi:predicted house-cleaning noncanonical NTP pyrophosphatase (MazG superfamily)